MTTNTEATEPGRRYQAAYQVHYDGKDLRDALGLYRGIIDAFPDAPEAGYSRAQVWNIVKSLVPKEELLDAHAGLALACLARRESTDGPAGVASP